MKTIGVLALQGAFIEHVNHIEKLGHKAVEIRKKDQLEGIDGIILPGGESTAIGKLLVDFDIKQALKEKIESGFPVWGTCAGMILLAKKLVDDPTVHLGCMDITVKRNAYGSQLDSFITVDNIKALDDKPSKLVFIRAPYIEAIGNTAKALHTVDENIVAARQENMMVTSFHPELTDETLWLEYFINNLVIN